MDEAKKTRVRTGCFCCRKRKKKCDERQPNCSGCVRNGIKCVYPHHEKETLPPDFHLETTHGDGRKRYKKRRIIVENDFKDRQIIFNAMVKCPTNKGISSKSMLQLEFNSKEERQDPPRKSEKEPSPFMDLSIDASSPSLVSMDVSSVDVSMDPSLLEFLGEGSGFPSVQQSKFQMTLSSQDAELYHTFRSCFMPSISLPHSHPLLSPEYVWVNLASESGILTQVNLYCGASVLAYNHRNNADLHNKFSLLAEQKYRQIVTSLGRIREEDIDSDGLLAAGLTLCLCDRSYGVNSRKAQHLIFVYNLIKRREQRKSAEIQVMQGDMARLTPDASVVHVTPTERSLMDSFVFNYSMTLFTCAFADLTRLPSPCKVFPELKKWLQMPIYTDISVSWVNNPVVGAAVGCFEIMSKLIWFMRFHFESESKSDPHWYIDNRSFWKLMSPLKDEIHETRGRINSYKTQLDQMYKTNPHPVISYADLRGNLAVATILIDAGEIMYEKLLNPSIPAFVPVIQEAVASALDEYLNHITVDNHSHCMLPLAIFIIGISTSTKEQKEMLMDRLSTVNYASSSNIGKNLIGTLVSNWENETAEEIRFGDEGFKCFDMIFDRSYFERIVF